jgi:DnaJ-class molecular chaperone
VIDARHPDKNPGCKECADKYIAIAEAHKQIVDYEHGVLKIRGLTKQEQQQEKERARQRRR